jgi:diguanylate cyclase (GGDEF)-like protein/PAS domain S-box-containing protein
VTDIDAFQIPTLTRGGPLRNDWRWWTTLAGFGVISLISLVQGTVLIIPLLWIVVLFAVTFASVRAVVMLAASSFAVAIAVGLRWELLATSDYAMRLLVGALLCVASFFLTRRLRARDVRMAVAEADYRTLAENASDVVVRTDTLGRVVWIAPTVTSTLGWSPDELVGQHLDQLLHVDDAPLFGASADGDRAQRVRSRDGGYVWVSAKLTALRDSTGTVVGSVVGMRDVDGLVSARESATRGEERLRATLDALTDPHIVLEPVRAADATIVDFVYLDANVAACDYNQLPYDELVGSTLLGLFPGHDDAGLVRLYAQVVDTGEPLSIDDLPYHQDRLDQDRSYDVRAFQIGGRLFCTWRDVSDRHAAALAVAESEEKFRLLAENASDVVYQSDPAGVIEWISPAVTQALGLLPDDLLGTQALDLIHPDDRAAVDIARAAFLDSGTLGTLSARYRTAVGDHRWMSIRLHVLRDDSGVPRGSVVALSDVTAERAAREELAYRAFHDPLTGLRNRAWILDMLDADLRASMRSHLRVGVLFVDLDNFKLVNDGLGHVAGDEVLAAIARRIADVLRPTDRVGRFGGDEFVVVVPDVHDAHEVELVAERVSMAIAVDLQIEGHRIVPSASIGIAVSTPDSTSASLLRDTDSALFRAKAAGRARWHFFDEEMHAQAIARLTTEDELRRAISAHEFVMHYQPIVSLDTGAVVGHEALIRWNHPVRGLLAPAEFLAVAEDSGLIVEIGHQALSQVCEILGSRLDILGPISVNMSPVQMARPGWRDSFLDTVARYGVDPRRLVIEVTETAVLSVIDVAREDLQFLRDLGIGVHVDDFGTGYSSISLLRDLPVTGLKLDGSFTGHLTDADDTALVLSAGIAGLAEGLHLTSIAEGIETLEQARILRDQGWSHGQGYLFSRPKPRIDSELMTETVALAPPPRH